MLLVFNRFFNYYFQLMENAVYTFEQLFSPSRQADPAKFATTIEKVKLRVLKVNVMQQHLHRRTFGSAFSETENIFYVNLSQYLKEDIYYYPAGNTDLVALSKAAHLWGKTVLADTCKGLYMCSPFNCNQISWI